MDGHHLSMMVMNGTQLCGMYVGSHLKVQAHSLQIVLKVTERRLHGRWCVMGIRKWGVGVKPGKNSIFLKKGKTVIQLKTETFLDLG